MKLLNKYFPKYKIILCENEKQTKYIALVRKGFGYNSIWNNLQSFVYRTHDFREKFIYVNSFENALERINSYKNKQPIKVIYKE